MAVIQHGTMDDFSISVGRQLEIKGEPSVLALGDAEAKSIHISDFSDSAERRGITLSALSMNEQFPGFIDRIFNLESKFYFLCWTWDMKSIHLYPGEITTPDTCLIPLRPSNSERRFIGDGVVLFPPRTVRGGIAVRVQIWESKQDVREFGALMQRIAALVSSSELNDVITGLGSAAAGGAIAGAMLAQRAAVKLTKAIGAELENSSDELVDYFEGYFSAKSVWQVGNQTYEGVGSSIELNMIE